MNLLFSIGSKAQNRNIGNGGMWTLKAYGPSESKLSYLALVPNRKNQFYYERCEL